MKDAVGLEPRTGLPDGGTGPPEYHLASDKIGDQAMSFGGTARRVEAQKKARASAPRRKVSIEIVRGQVARPCRMEVPM